MNKVNLYVGVSNSHQRKVIDNDLRRRMAPRMVYLTGVVTPPVATGLPPGLRQLTVPPIGPSMGKSSAYVAKHGFPKTYKKAKP